MKLKNIVISIECMLKEIGFILDLYKLNPNMNSEAYKQLDQIKDLDGAYFSGAILHELIADNLLLFCRAYRRTNYKLISSPFSQNYIGKLSIITLVI